MIPQVLMDFFRDLFVAALVSFNGVLPVEGLAAAGAGLGVAAAATSNILWLLFGSGWSSVVAAFFVYLTVYSLTAAMAVVGRRLT